VMNKGKIAMTGKPGEIFAKADLLEEMGLGIPQVTQLIQALNTIGKNIPTDIFSLEDIKTVILECIRSREHA